MKPPYTETLSRLSPQDFVQRAYVVHLRRSADPKGAEYYLARLSEGKERKSIWNDIAASSHSIMRNLVVEGIETEKMLSLTAIKKALSLSEDAFLYSAYQLILRREADISGIETYTLRLKQGFSRQHVLVSLANSSEGRNRSLTKGLRLYFSCYKLAQLSGPMGLITQKLAGMVSDRKGHREMRARLNKF